MNPLDSPHLADDEPDIDVQLSADYMALMSFDKITGSKLPAAVLQLHLTFFMIPSRWQQCWSAWGNHLLVDTPSKSYNSVRRGGGLG